LVWFGFRIRRTEVFIFQFRWTERAVVGSLGNESIKIQKGCKNYFYFFENIFSENA